MMETLPVPPAHLGGGTRRASAFNPARAIGLKESTLKPNVEAPLPEVEEPPPPKTPLQMTLTCSAARIECLGGAPLSCSASFDWQHLDSDVEQISLESVKYFLELQQMDRGTQATAPTSVDSDWTTVYEGSDAHCMVEGLKPGRLFAVRVTASVEAEVLETFQSSHEIESVIVEPSALTTFETPPSAPSMPSPPLLVQRARNALKLKWSAPEETGGEEALTHVLFIHPHPAGMEPSTDPQEYVKVYEGDEYSFKVGKLQAGTRYSTQLQAFNSVGPSPMSLTSTFTTAATVPSAPAPPGATSCTATSITLQWTSPPDNGSPISTYALERDDGPVQASEQTHGSAPACTEFQHVYVGPMRSATASGLIPGVLYRFRLRAENNEGKSSWSVSGLANTGPTTPGPPAGLSVKDVNRDSGTVSWRSPLDIGGGVIMAYQAELQPNCRAANESMGPKAVCIYEGDALACTLRVLRAGCAYRLRVRAFNKAGCGPWCPAVDFSSGTDVPDSTSEVEVLGAGSDYLDLLWAAPRHDGGSKICNYRLEQFVVSGPSSSGNTLANMSPQQAHHPVYHLSSTDSCNIIIPNLAPATTYRFRVQAVNNNGCGPWSAAECAATFAAAPRQPQAPTAIAATGHSLTLAWDFPDSQGDSVKNFAIETCQMEFDSPSSHVSTPDLPTHQTGYPSNSAAACNGSSSGSSSHCDGALLHQILSPGGRPDGMLLHANRALHAHSESKEDIMLDASTASLLSGSIEGVNCAYSIPSCSSSVSPPSPPPAPLGPWHCVYQGLHPTCEIRDLVPATRYAFRVAAANAVGYSPWSSAGSATTSPAPPCSPHGLVATPISSGALDIRWQPPQVNNGSPVSLYTLETCSAVVVTALTTAPGINAAIISKHKGVRAPTGPSARHFTSSPTNTPSGPLTAAASSPWQQIYSGPACKHTLSGLHPGRSYLVRVRAANACGHSPFSGPSSATTLPAPPSPPGPLAFGQRTSSSVKVKWSESKECYGARVFSYSLQMALMISQPSQLRCSLESNPMNGLASSASSAVDLAADGRYLQASLAENANGLGSIMSVASRPTTPASAFVEHQQSDSTRHPLTHDMLSLQPSHSASSLSSSSCLAPPTLHYHTVYCGDDTFTKVLGLQPGTCYSFRVCSANSAGQSQYSPSAEVITSLSPPGPPCNILVVQAPLSRKDTLEVNMPNGVQAMSLRVACDSLSEAVLVVTWSPPDSSAFAATAISYEVVVSQWVESGSKASSSSLSSSVTTGGKGVCEVRLDGLLPATCYTVRLRSVGADGSGHSAWSSDVLVRTQGLRADLSLLTDGADGDSVLGSPRGGTGSSPASSKGPGLQAGKGSKGKSGGAAAKGNVGAGLGAKLASCALPASAASTNQGASDSSVRKGGQKGGSAENGNHSNHAGQTGGAHVRASTKKVSGMATATAAARRPPRGQHWLAALWRSKRAVLACRLMLFAAVVAAFLALLLGKEEELHTV